MADPTSPTTPRPRSRAVALPAAERRARIVESVQPLVLSRGAAVTSRELADAAGIAEGTIFRVFRDKDELIDAVVDALTDVGPVVDALDRVDRSLPLVERLVAAVEIIRQRVTVVFQLTSALGPRSNTGRPGIDRARVAARVDALAAVIEPDRQLVRRTPAEAARLLHGLTIASTYPLLTDDRPLSSAEIVSLFLDGVALDAPPSTPTTQDPPC